MTYGTMEKIETVTVPSGGQAAIEFTNVKQTYDDLQIVLSARASDPSVTSNAQVRFNGASSGWTTRYVYSILGSGIAGSSTETGTSQTSVQVVGNNATASTFSNSTIYIPNYRGNVNKVISVDTVAENNSSTAASLVFAGALWSSTAAITSISLTPSSGTWLQHTTATLYGITRVPAGAKATGGVIYDDSSYWYHVFTSSGTFTPSASFNADIMIVAGGAGGGLSLGGGGGAGGLLGLTSQGLTAQNYTVTIGAGGAGSSNPSTSRGANGSNSLFGANTAIGGGGGTGQSVNYPNGPGGASGGSGGGGARNNNAAGSGTSGQGNSGGLGAGDPGTSGGSGGGGGAGAVGGNGVLNGAGGNGGVGSTSYSSWGLVTNTGEISSGVSYFAGGGAGASHAGAIASGGLGGGGIGSVSTGIPGNGIANTGGGGGGKSEGSSGTGGNGGSGIVIVRYAK